MSKDWENISEIEQSAVIQWVDKNYDFVLQEVEEAGKRPMQDIDGLSAQYVNACGITYIREIMSEMS